MTLVFETGGDVVKPQTVSSLIRLIGEGSGDQKADETLRANAVSWLLYTSDAADDLPRVDHGGRRPNKNKKTTNHRS